MSLLYTAHPDVRAKMSKENRMDHDFYPTRLYDIHATYRYFEQRGTIPHGNFKVLDIGAGTGPWGMALKEYRTDCHITGIDIRDIPQPDGYDEWHQGNFLTMPFVGQTFDFIIGNPPYNIAQEIIEKAWLMLNKNGSILMLLLLNFWSTQDRAADFWRRITARHIGVYAKRLSFMAHGRTDAREYGGFDLAKNWNGETTTGHIVQPELVGKYEFPEPVALYANQTSNMLCQDKMIL